MAMQRRFSPRINDLGDEKRPHCGNDQKELLEASSSQRQRVSPRLQNIPKCKKPYYGSSSKKPLEAQDSGSKKKVKVDHWIEVCQLNRAREFGNDEGYSGGMHVGSVPVKRIEGKLVKSEDENLKRTSFCNGIVDKFGKGTFMKVKEMLRIINLHYLRNVQEEEKRCRKVEISDLQIVNGSKTNKFEIFNLERNVDQLPGVEVGHQFFSCTEMVAVGFHGQWLGGFDRNRESSSKLEYHGYTFPLAVTIVLCGQIEYGVDNLEEIIYTTQGGNDFLCSKNQVNDQVMHLRNLALKHNMDRRVPVRVIHGHECGLSYTGKVYTYDGIYKVVSCWTGKGFSRNTGFKYRLERLKEPPKVATKDQVVFMRGRVSEVPNGLPGLVCMDISCGQEDICIPATNVIDNPPVAPSGFTYIKSIQVAKNIIVPPTARGCNCKGSCTNPRSCSCAQLNGFDFPYVHQDGGRLIEAKDVVFECGPGCGCGPACVNRITQLGLKYRLEVYRTKDKGWAVRSWDFIPSGAPVCEYTGVLRRSDELDNVSENDFIFEIDCWQTMNELEGRERRLCNLSIRASNLVKKTNEKVSESAPEFCIDAGQYGNVARFINHCCEPNLFVQCVLSSHHDIRLARVVLFAADDIPPMQELTYDYGYALDSVVGPNGEIKILPCYCGAVECRKRLY